MLIVPFAFLSRKMFVKVGTWAQLILTWWRASAMAQFKDHSALLSLWLILNSSTIPSKIERDRPRKTFKDVGRTSLQKYLVLLLFTMNVKYVFFKKGSFKAPRLIELLPLSHASVHKGCWKILIFYFVILLSYVRWLVMVYILPVILYSGMFFLLSFSSHISPGNYNPQILWVP